MTRSADVLLHELTQRRMPGLPDLPWGEFIAPAYDGLSIANIPATIAALLGGSLPPHPTLPRELWADWLPGLKRVILVLLDALGYTQLTRQAAWDEEVAPFRRIADAGRLVPLTSIFPSTTTAALLTLWTGRTPAEHGLLGYELFLREFGVLSNMIKFSPVHEPAFETLVGWGLDPAKFAPVPGIAEVLGPQGIRTRDLIHRSLLNSGLSRTLRRGEVDSHGYVTVADMWAMLRQMLAERPAQPELITVYWDGADGVGHAQGPDSENWQAEVRSVAQSIEREFLRRLSPAGRDGTLLLITADHGQITTLAAQATLLGQHPGLADLLTVPPAGEARAAYLFPRHGRRDGVLAYFADHLPGQFALVNSAAALEAGLFGPGLPAPETPFRIGDLLAIARGPSLLNRGTQPPQSVGRHGGLTPEEMLVPFMGARLEALQ